MMKKLLIGLMALASFSALSKTISHNNCRLNGTFFNQELNMIFEAKGYILYDGPTEPGTLLFNTVTLAETDPTHPFSVMVCLRMSDKWAQITHYATIHHYEGPNQFKVSAKKASYHACYQSGDRKKDERAFRRLLHKLPDCELN